MGIEFWTHYPFGLNLYFVLLLLLLDYFCFYFSFYTPLFLSTLFNDYDTWFSQSSGGN